MLDDQPCVSEEGKPTWDGLTALARQIAALLGRGNTGSSQNLALARTPILVTGDWGSGKTTLLLKVKAIIEGDGPSEAGGGASLADHIWFDAWQYEGDGRLLPALVGQVWSAAQARRAGAGSDVKALLATHGAEAVGAALAISIRWGAPLAMLLGGPLAAAGAVAITNIADATKVAADAKRYAPGIAGPEPDPRDQLREALRKVLIEGWTIDEEDPSSWPVVFIDDLDRCAPDKAIELLEQVRGLVVAQGGQSKPLPCRFILAMDRDLLVHAISHKFSSLHGYDGNRYIEKVFPLAFAVPRPSRDELHRLVASLFDKAWHQEPRDTHTDRRHIVTQVFQDETFANPRLAIRCINKYLLIVRWEEEQREREPPKASSPQFDEQQDRYLVAWLAACERWPALRKVITIEEDHWWSRLQVALQEAPSQERDPQVVGLISQPGAALWLRTSMLRPGARDRDNFRRADDRMRRWGF